MRRKRFRRWRRSTLVNTLRYDYFAQFYAATKKIQVQNIGLNGINRPYRLLRGTFTFTIVDHTRCPAI